MVLTIGYTSGHCLFRAIAETRLKHGLWHEVRLEVDSQEVIRVRKIVDFGEGSVGSCGP
jgi:hypothetical protein